MFSWRLLRLDTSWFFKIKFPCCTRLNPCVAHCSTDSIPWVLTLKGRRVPWLWWGICPLANPNELWYVNQPSTLAEGHSQFPTRWKGSRVGLGKILISGKLRPSLVNTRACNTSTLLHGSWWEIHLTTWHILRRILFSEIYDWGEGNSGSNRTKLFFHSQS
jgi:hypothetical protein